MGLIFESESCGQLINATNRLSGIGSKSSAIRPRFQTSPPAAAQAVSADPITKLRRVKMRSGASLEGLMIVQAGREAPDSNIDRICSKGGRRLFGSAERTSFTGWTKAGGASAASSAGDGLAERPCT